MNDYPEYLHIDEDLTADDIRELLSELVKKNASDSTAKLFATLALIEPGIRLALNLKKLLTLLTQQHRITDVLRDGLLEPETKALIELDRKYFSDTARRTARMLLNVKERWILAKCTSGLFNKYNTSGAYIDISLEKE